MEQITKEQMEKTIENIKSFKQIINEKGSKAEAVSFLVIETGLTKDECELAYNFYNNIQLPENL